MHQEQKINPCDPHFFFSSFTHSNTSRLTVGVPRHLGWMHTFKVRSTEHTPVKHEETVLLSQPLRTSFSPANARLLMGMESHSVKHGLKAKQHP